MVRRSAEIRNKAGIHVRPSGVIMNEISTFSGQISLKHGDTTVEISNIMALLSLGLVQGDRIEIIVEGGDEEAEADKLRELFQRNFDFPGREQG